MHIIARLGAGTIDDAKPFLRNIALSLSSAITEFKFDNQGFIGTYINGRAEQVVIDTCKGVNTIPFVGLGVPNPGLLIHFCKSLRAFVFVRDRYYKHAFPSTDKCTIVRRCIKQLNEKRDDKCHLWGI